MPTDSPTSLVDLRSRLRELEEAFALAIRAPEWPSLPDGEKDSRGWEVHNARIDLKHAERMERDAQNRARKAADEARRLLGGEADCAQPGANGKAREP